MLHFNIQKKFKNIFFLREAFNTCDVTGDT